MASKNKEPEKIKGPRTKQPYFNGPEATEDDQPRLLTQHQIIKKLMLDGRWRTLPEIERATAQPPASISAQLRHLRKPRFGEYQVERRHRDEAGLFEYRVLAPKAKGQLGLFEELNCRAGRLAEATLVQAETRAINAMTGRRAA